MKVSLKTLLDYITPTDLQLPEAWDQFHDLLEDIGLEVKNVDRDQEPGDIIFTLELLANRGDHHCYMGLAREIHQRTAWQIQYPAILDIETRNESVLANVTSQYCLAYTLTEYVRDAEEIPLSDFYSKMITLGGANQVSPAVDVTNLVNIELGQPMHVFDADKISGQICVRDSLAGEKAQLLGAEEAVALPEATLVIADEEKILAVAGVMGCETSKVTEASQHILLESGTFDPVKVRKAARALGVQSLAAARFERGADPEAAEKAVKRAHQLLTGAGWNLVKGISLCKVFQEPSFTIEVSLKALNHYFSTNYSAQVIAPIFERMGSPSVEVSDTDSAISVIGVQIPGHRRWDLVNQTDLFEEVARAKGYNSLPSKMPASASGARVGRPQKRLNAVEQILVSAGFYEIFTDSFYSDQDVARLGITDEQHPLSQHVRINNSETKAYSLLKNNNLVQALDAISTNQRVKTQQVQVFERNKRFIRDTNAANGLCHELEVIWGLALGESISANWQHSARVFDVFYLKGLVENIATKLGLEIRILPKAENDGSHPYLDVLHPSRRAVVEVKQEDWKVCGVIGEVHPKIVKAFGLKNIRPYFFELEQSLLDLNAELKSYDAPRSILPVKRDLCFGLYQQQEAGYIADLLAQSSDWLESVEISDLFIPETDPEQSESDSVRAVTFSLMLDPVLAGKDVFSGAEINDEIERLAQKVLDHFGESNVKRR